MLAGIVALVVLMVPLVFQAKLWGHNIRTVVDGRVYRSSLLPPERLEALLQEKKVRTVISLMGGDESTSWFRREDEIAHRHGGSAHSVQFQATRLPPPEQVKALLDLFDHSEYPVLIHCRSGSDRTGLAATLYLHLYAGIPLDEAQRRGLTWRYGHFRLFTPAMDQFFDLYRKDQKQYDLRTWILERYPRVYEERTGGRKSAAASPSGVSLKPVPGAIVMDYWSASEVREASFASRAAETIHETAVRIYEPHHKRSC